MGDVIENKKIEIGEATLKKLNTARKWAMFLAIAGYIFLGLVVIIGLITGTFLSAFDTGDNSQSISELHVFLLLFIFIAVCLFPVMFLFRFSKYTAMALQSLDNQKLHRAIRNLKSFFVFLGILFILILVLYFVFVIAGTSTSFLRGL